MKHSVMIFSYIFLWLSTSCFALEEAKQLNTNSTVVLTGILSVEKFFDANDIEEESYILTLDNPVSVTADEYGGPVNEVSKVQIVLLKDNVVTKYLNKRIQIEGMLFYPMTAHHHAGILLRTKKVID